MHHPRFRHWGKWHGLQKAHLSNRPLALARTTKQQPWTLQQKTTRRPLFFHLTLPHQTSPWSTDSSPPTALRISSRPTSSTFCSDWFLDWTNLVTRTGKTGYMKSWRCCIIQPTRLYDRSTTEARPSNPNTATQQPPNFGSTNDPTYPDVGGSDLNPLRGADGGLRMPG